MSIYYKIKLRPLEPYFFGQELSEELGNRQSYFQHSALFPQQTSLLGMLRYQLLLLDDLIPLGKNRNRQEAEKRIGRKGFRVGTIQKTFGKIEELSPVLLSRQEKGKTETTYILRDKEVVEYKNKKANKIENQALLLDSSTSSTLYHFGVSAKNEGKTTPKLALENGEMYLAKYPFQEILHAYDGENLTSIDCKNKLEAIKNISHTDTRVGIYKSFEGETENEGYYKKSFKDLEENWSFVFYAKFSEEIADFEGENRPVTLGKEQSTFSMAVEKIEDEPPIFKTAVIEEEDAVFKIVLLSDAYICSESKLYEHSLLVNAETKFFRYIQTCTNQDDFYTPPTKSNLFNLLKRGGVIYTKNPKAIASLLEGELEIQQISEKANVASFRKIGYNYFAIEKN